MCERNEEKFYPSDLPYLDIYPSDERNYPGLENKFSLSDKNFTDSMNFSSEENFWGGVSPGMAFSEIKDFWGMDDSHKESLINILKLTVEKNISEENYFLNRTINYKRLANCIQKRPELIDQWLEPTQVKAPKIIHIASTFYESLCCALLYVSDSRAIKLYNLLRNTDRKITTRELYTEIWLPDNVLFSSDPQELAELKRIWKERIYECKSDGELLGLVIAAEQGTARQWLLDKSLEDSNSSINLDFSFGISILGFMDSPVALKHLEELYILGIESWRQTLIRLSIARWKQNSWAKHWFKQFCEASDSVDAWSAFRLFLRCVDRRFWLWKDQYLNYDMPKKHLIFFEDNQMTIQNSIRKNEKKSLHLTKRFLGHKIAERQAWPWFE